MIFSPLAGKPVVSQWFGSNPEWYAQFGMKGHNGIDFDVPTGTKVYAPHEGYVQLKDTGNTGYGRHIVITSRPYKADGTCRRTTLAHLSTFNVTEGQFISLGDPIALSGNSGYSTGPHLHWTYCLLNANLQIINYDNGFKGAIDLAPKVNGKRTSFIQLWTLGNILA